MRSARSLYRLSIALGGLGVVVLLGGLAAAIRAIDLQGSEIGAVATACTLLLSLDATSSSLAVAALSGLGLATAGLGLASFVRQWHQQWRFFATLREIESVTIGEAPVTLIEDERPQAFCAGYLRPRVYLSTAALIALDDTELRAVVEHERHHQRRRDPLRVLIVHVLADALFFVPVLRRLHERYTALAEVAADEAAVHQLGDRAPLASALLTFGDRPSPSIVVGIAPERVDHLLGTNARWRLSRSLLLAGLATLGGLIALVAATVQATAPGQIGLPQLAAELCMLAMTTIAAILGAGLLLLGARWTRAAAAR